MTYSLLLVEDNPGDALLVEEGLLEGAHLAEFRLRHVTRVSEAHAALAADRFDAVLLDLNLPDSTGLATLSVVSAHANGAPIIILTGTDDESMGLRAVRNGAHDYLVKGQVFGTMMARAILYAIQRVESDRVLHATETQHRILFETMAQGAVYYDRNGHVLSANPAMLDLLGWSVGEITNHTIFEFAWRLVQADGSPFPIDQLPTVYSLKTGAEKNSTIMGIYNVRDHEYRWVMVHARPHFRDGETLPYQVFTTYTDITAIRRAEEALKAKEERFRALLEHSHDLKLILSKDGVVTYCSSNVSAILGYSAEDVVGRHFTEFVTPSFEESSVIAFQRIADGTEAQQTVSCDAVHKDGSMRRVEAFVRNHLDHPAIQGVVANVQDISERHAAEQELRLAHERLAAVVDTSPLAIIVVDEACKVQLWNHAAETIFGWTAAEVIGQPYPLRSPDDTTQSPDKIFQSSFSGGLLEGVELERITKSGSTVSIQLWNAQLHGKDGRIAGLIGIMADVSERRTLQESLRHAQKMEAVGRLAGGVAHDFNNILTVLGGHAGMLLDGMPETDPMYEDLLEIHRGVDRASMLTRQLLAFSRKQVVQPKVIDLGQITQDMRKMLERILGEDVRLRLNEAVEALRVKVDPGQLEQVIVNLAVNARDAMTGGGELIVDIGPGPSRKNGLPAELPYRKQGYLVLSVRDTGTGIEPELLAKIFEPFFTTKAVGKGTGLGLSTAYGIIQQAGGAITVESVVGEGTTFRIFLPRVNEAPTAADKKPAATKRGSGTILLVEDEQAVRQLTGRVLERHGYTVLAAASGKEAVAIAERQAHVDLLITDVVMPDMNGPEVATLMNEKWLGLKSLFMSGYSEETITDRGILKEGLNFLEKPFTTDQLLAKVGQVMAQTSRFSR